MGSLQPVAPLRWAVIGTGSDLVTNPALRGVKDGTSHSIVAFASRTAEKAQEFASRFPELKGSRYSCYGTYAAALKDPNVDVAYIGTPHTQHFSNAREAICSGKHVLLEKPATVTAEQTEYLLDLAAKHKVFFMEAVWTRFHPITKQIQETVQSGLIGEVRHMNTNFCMDCGVEQKLAEGHRLVSRNTAGGSILDVGPYTFLWVSLLFPALFDSDSALPDIKASAAMHQSGIDLTTQVLLSSRQNPYLTATMTTSLARMTPLTSCVEVVGTKGTINVDWPPFRPEGFTVTRWKTEEEAISLVFDGTVPKDRTTIERFEVPHADGINGLSWEADEVARCIRDGKQQSDIVSWKDTLTQMKLFDEVRKQIGLDYGEELQSLQ
ncbi:NAD(P)-binding protein [Meredithblackwellia eburnea MCA 4105]